jgi:uncharacterized membrane protein YphA (DoxX/SURF4 family)
MIPTGQRDDESFGVGLSSARRGLREAPCGIYVEIRIRGDLDALWRRTQDPALHERWDLRFSEITYLSRAGEHVPQHFTYQTRIGFGLRIAGMGESTGTRSLPNGARTSALSFWSDDRKSLIREGSGYWHYAPTENGVRFVTWYDYRTRFGWLGRVIDAVLFRPLIGWATAWSFDRLRLWIERQIDPALALRQAAACAIARLAIALVFIYQGLVPKLLYHHAGELTLLSASGIPPVVAPRVLTAVGIAEIALGLLVMLIWTSRWPLIVTIALMVGALIDVAVTAPSALVAAFNPVTLNAAIAALAAIVLLLGGDVPSASRCLRSPSARES